MEFKNLPNGTTIQFMFWNDEPVNGVILNQLSESKYEVEVNNKLGKVMVEEEDILNVIDTNKRYEYIPVQIQEEIEEEIEEVIEEVKPKYHGLFALGGESVAMIENMPNELTLYVPIFEGNGNPSTDEEIEERVRLVKQLFKEYFGDYISHNYGSSYIDSDGKLVFRKHIQVTTYPTDSEFMQYKQELIYAISRWAQEWNQEYIVLEYEDKTHHILPIDDFMKRGGEIWIQDAISKMEKKGTIGAFVKQAKREGMTTIEFAKKVLKNPKGYALKTRRRANFVKNTNPELFQS